MIKVVNFPFCNYFSLERYFRTRELSFDSLNTFDQLKSEDSVVLPGVGTFKQGMEFLLAMNLVKPIQDHAERGGRIVGICLGMQMLLHSSAESPGIQGLGLIPGSCERIPKSSSFSVPHIGWNQIKIANHQSNVLATFRESSGWSKSDFYFVHSYYANPLDSSAVIASFRHPLGMFAAAVASKNNVGFQFHPEKSGSAGYELLDTIFMS